MTKNRWAWLLCAALVGAAPLACGGSEDKASDAQSQDADASVAGADSGFEPPEMPDGGTSGEAIEPGTTTIDPTQFAASAATESSATYDADDLVEKAKFAHTVRIDLSAKQAWLIEDGAEAPDKKDITEAGTALFETEEAEDDATVVTSITLAEADGVLTVTSTVSAAIRYELTGSYSGTVVMENAKKYAVYLDGASITAVKGPALSLPSKQRVFIVLADGTENSLTDSKARDEDLTVKGALYSKGIMVISGSGSLTVTGHYKHGIADTKYLRIAGGDIAVNVDARDAIRADRGFVMDDGKLTIRGTGSATDDESKGIKVEGSEDGDTGNIPNGTITINGGTIDIETVSKAITASWEAEDDATTDDTSDDPTPTVTINGGYLKLKTTGTPYEYYETVTAEDGSTTQEKISLSPEGIEGKAGVIINGGYIVAETTDDAVQSGGSIAINGGYLYAAASQNDAIDSNGTMTITGGVVVAIGASAPEGSFDCDQNTFKVTGGTFVGIGGDHSAVTASVSTQNTVSLGSGTKGQMMALRAGDGSAAFAFHIPQSYSSMILSSPKITTGTDYTVVTGCTASAEESFYGLYLGDVLTCEGGTEGTSFTVSSTVTNAGGGSGQGGPGGEPPGGGQPPGGR